MPKHDPDRRSELVDRARQGDYRAFEKLVREDEGRLYRLALGIVHHPQDAEDAVQIALVSALEHLGDFRGEAAGFPAWLNRIAVNAALRLLSRRRGISLEQLAGPGAEETVSYPAGVAAWASDPGDLAERSEIQRVLEEAVADLPENLRLVFVLRELAGLSTRDTAESLDLPEGTVKVRLLRARLALREKLAAFWETWRPTVRETS